MKRIVLALLVLTPRLLSAQAEPGTPAAAELEARLAAASGEERIDVLSQLGEAYRGQGDLAAALARFRAALKLARELDAKGPIAGNLLAIGQIHFREGRLPAAAETLRRARAAADEPEARRHLPDILDAQAAAYAALGRHREAYAALRQAVEAHGSGEDRGSAARLAELEASLEAEREEAEAESSRQRQEIARQQQEIARLEPRAARFSRLALAAGVAVPLLLLGLAASLLARRRLAKRSSEVIANRDLEIEQTSAKLKSASAELERAGGELERKTFDHNRATSDLAQTSAKLERANARLEAADALREQTSVSLAETAGQLERSSEQLGRTLRQLDETEGELERLKASYGQDIAELGDRNAAARDRLDEMERFSSNVAQHLKILLVAIRSSLGALQQDAAAGDVQQLKKDVERARGTVGHTVRLLDQLLKLLMVGRVVRPHEEIPMSELAFEAVGQVAGLVANRRAEIVISPELPVVVGDRGQLLEVLRNLLENGGKFMGPQLAPRLEVGGRLDEYAGAAPETVYFVRDNGIGIDPRDHQRVFVLFEQLSPNTEGDGIGLALVKRILESHGGRIWVESEGEGRGSTFCFTLPPKAEPPPQADDAAAAG